MFEVKNPKTFFATALFLLFVGFATAQAGEPAPQINILSPSDGETVSSTDYTVPVSFSVDKFWDDCAVSLLGVCLVPNDYSFQCAALLSDAAGTITSTQDLGTFELDPSMTENVFFPTLEGVSVGSHSLRLACTKASGLGAVQAESQAISFVYNLAVSGCTDSDAGEPDPHYVKGTCTEGVETASSIREDYCEGNTLYEYACVAPVSAPGEAQCIASPFECPNGCENGRCLAEGEAPQPLVVCVTLPEPSPSPTATAEPFEGSTDATLEQDSTVNVAGETFTVLDWSDSKLMLKDAQGATVTLELDEELVYGEGLSMTLTSVDSFTGNATIDYSETPTVSGTTTPGEGKEVCLVVYEPEDGAVYQESDAIALTLMVFEPSTLVVNPAPSPVDEGGESAAVKGLKRLSFAEVIPGCPLHKNAECGTLQNEGWVVQCIENDFIPNKPEGWGTCEYLSKGEKVVETDCSISTPQGPKQGSKFICNPTQYDCNVDLWCNWRSCKDQGAPENATCLASKPENHHVCEEAGMYCDSQRTKRCYCPDPLPPEGPTTTAEPTSEPQTTAVPPGEEPESTAVPVPSISVTPKSPPPEPEDYYCWYGLDGSEEAFGGVKLSETYSKDLFPAGAQTVGEHALTVYCDALESTGLLPVEPLLETPVIHFTVEEEEVPPQEERVVLELPENKTYWSAKVPWAFVVYGDETGYYCNGVLDGVSTPVKFRTPFAAGDDEYLIPPNTRVNGEFDLTDNYGEHETFFTCISADPVEGQAEFASDKVRFTNLAPDKPVITYPVTKTYWADELDVVFKVGGNYPEYECKLLVDGKETGDQAKTVPGGEPAGQNPNTLNTGKLSPGKHYVEVSCTGLPGEATPTQVWVKSDAVTFYLNEPDKPVISAPKNGSTYSYSMSQSHANVKLEFEVGGTYEYYVCSYTLNGSKTAWGAEGAQVPAAKDPSKTLQLSAGAYALFVSCTGAGEAGATEKNSDTVHFTVKQTDDKFLEAEVDYPEENVVYNTQTLDLKLDLNSSFQTHSCDALYCTEAASLPKTVGAVIFTHNKSNALWNFTIQEILATKVVFTYSSVSESKEYVVLVKDWVEVDGHVVWVQRVLVAASGTQQSNATLCYQPGKKAFEGVAQGLNTFAGALTPLVTAKYVLSAQCSAALTGASMAAPGEQGAWFYSDWTNDSFTNDLSGGGGGGGPGEPYCGDGVCNVGETPENCPFDCGYPGGPGGGGPGGTNIYGTGGGGKPLGLGEGEGIPTPSPKAPGIPTPTARAPSTDTFLELTCPKTTSRPTTTLTAVLKVKGALTCDNALKTEVTINASVKAGGSLKSCSAGKHLVAVDTKRAGEYLARVSSPAYGAVNTCTFSSTGAEIEEAPELIMVLVILVALAAIYLWATRYRRKPVAVKAKSKGK